MHTLNTRYGITVDISEELIKDYQQDLHGFHSLAHKLDIFAELDATYLRNFLIYRNYQNIYGSIRMLEAHANSKTKHGFMYADLEHEQLIWNPLTDWLNQHDGKYDILYIACYNEGKIELPKRTSTLIYPIGIYNGEALIREAAGKYRSNLIIV